MSKIYKILFLSVGLFFITNEAWMAKRKMQWVPKKSSIFKSLTDFVIDIKPLAEEAKIPCDVKLFDNQTDEKVIKIAKELVRMLPQKIFYDEILKFLIKKTKLSSVQTLIKLDFCLNSDVIRVLLEKLSDAADLLNVDLKDHRVLNYLQVNNNLLTCAYLGKGKECHTALQAGAYINVRSYNDFNTPLHVNVSSPLINEVCIDVLIKAEADVNAQDDDGQTPLHVVLEKYGACSVAYYAGDLQQIKEIYKSVMRKLLVAGAKTDIKDREGKTAFNLAQEYELKDLFAEFGIH